MANRERDGRFTVGRVLRLLWEKRFWWLIPLAVLVLLFILLMLFSPGDALSPHLYTDF